MYSRTHAMRISVFLAVKVFMITCQTADE